MNIALNIIIHRSPLARMDASWALLALRDVKEKEVKLIWEKAKKDKNANFTKEEKALCDMIIAKGL